MKKLLSILLVIATLASLVSGCGGKAEEPAAQAAPETEGVVETTAEPTAAPTTEPTLSAEEMLYNSLSDRMKQAVDVGLVELSQMEDLDRVVTIAEAAAMLQKAFIHRVGVESKVLNDYMTEAKYAEIDADRGWIYNVPGLAELELAFGDDYQNLKQWISYAKKPNKNDFIWGTIDERLGMMGGRLNDDRESYYQDFNNTGMLQDDFWDYENLRAAGDSTVYGLADPSGWYGLVSEYAGMLFDSTNGKRFFSTENDLLNPTKKLTVSDVAEYALIYYHAPNPMAYPEFASPEEVGTYNTNIITPDLLEKETDLPEASCTSLPASWHGVVMDDMQLTYVNGHWDNYIYEYEIQAVKDAGFNYIGLEMDFGWLQDYFLFSGRKGYEKFEKSADKGKLSLERLEQLDQVVAYCIKYDIHLNLRATGVGSYDNAVTQEKQAANQVGLDQSFAALWQAIARRYADIPNEYLSFTLFTGTDTKLKDATILPSIDAIRAESPDRCIIADIYREGMVSSVYAEQGVALSYRMGKDNCAAFEVNNDDIVVDQRGTGVFKDAGVNMVKSFTWPYQDTVDAAALLTSGKGETCQTVMETASAYGVGFMLGEFGVSYPDMQSSSIKRNTYPRFRYPDTEYQEMIVDITSTMESLGYGWCFGSWYGLYGMAFGLDVITDTTYVQVKDYPYYLDQTTIGWFQEINGVQ